MDKSELMLISVLGRESVTTIVRRTPIFDFLVVVKTALRTVCTEHACSSRYCTPSLLFIQEYQPWLELACKNNNCWLESIGTTARVSSS